MERKKIFKNGSDLANSIYYTLNMRQRVRDSDVSGKEREQTPTFSKRDHDQGPVHEDGVRQMLGHSNRLRLIEFYKTDTGSHRQGRVIRWEQLELLYSS